MHDDLRLAPLEASAALPANGSASVICFSTADWDAPLWTNKQHLMSRLAASGVPVLYMDSLGLRAPGLGAADVSRMLRRVASWRPYAQPCEPGVLRDSPLVIPLHRYATVRALNRRLLESRLRRNERRHRLHRPVIWAYQPSGGDAYVPGRHAGLVYHCVDDLAAYPGIDAASWRAGERELVSRADVCIASSMPLVAHLEELGAHDVRYWPNPADTESYRAAASHRVGGPANGRPVIGFVGAVQEHKVDIPLVRTLAAMRPDWTFRMIGPVGIGLSESSIDVHSFPANVEFLGLRSRAELPGLVAGFDAGVIPYRINGYTSSVFPMKVFEYLGAGLPVVATRLPSIIGEVEHVAFADDAHGFAAALDAALEGDDDARLVRSEYASAFSWSNRTGQALELLTSLSA